MENVHQFHSEQLYSESGVSILELALLLPILFLFIAGIVDFGLTLNSTKSSLNAARHAARVSAAHSRVSWNAPCGKALQQARCTPDQVNTPLAVGMSVTESAHRTACSFLDRSALTAGQWGITASVSEKTEDGSQFKNINVKVERLDDSCIICVGELGKFFAAQSESSITLEGSCLAL